MRISLCYSRKYLCIWVPPAVANESESNTTAKKRKHSMSTPLIETNDAGLITRAYNLGLKVVSNIPHILCEEDLSYWETHLPELKEALARGLVRSNFPASTGLPEKKVVKYHSIPEVVSNGLNGTEWVARLREKKFDLGSYAVYCMTKGKDANGNLGFVATNGVIYKPVVIKGEEFTDSERVTSNIRKIANELGLITPPAELEPLIREAVSDEDMAKMGLEYLVTMHEPIIDSDRNPDLLGSYRYGGGRRLEAYDGYPTDSWGRRDGFVFLAPLEVSPVILDIE